MMILRVIGMDAGFEDKKNSWPVQRRRVATFDSSWLWYLFTKTLIITSKIETAKPGDAFEDTAFEPGFEIVKL